MTARKRYTRPRKVVAIYMGGSVHRTAVSPPASPRPTTDHVRSKVKAALGTESTVEVGFFGGGLPGRELLEACDGHAIRISCAPADLFEVKLEEMFDLGVRTIELDALTLNDRILHRVRSQHSSRQVHNLVRDIKAIGFRVGMVLSTGLPGSNREVAMGDVQQIGQMFAAGGGPDFARIHPTLAWEGSDLAAWVLAKRWKPMALDETIELVATMMEELGVLGVPVIRVGLQPGQDLPNKAVAGPFHPDLRGRVEVLRFRRKMCDLVASMAENARIELRVHPKDLSWAKGTSNENSRWLRASFGFAEVQIVADASIKRCDVGLVKTKQPSLRHPVISSG